MKGTKRIGWWLTMIVMVMITVSMTTTSQAADWWENVKIKGDFRYRHEIIDQELKEIRHRQRIRARINIEGKVSEYGKIFVGISSGSSDPVSNNQTLGDAFSSKDVLLDIAYFELNCSKVDGLQFLGGKTKNPFFLPGGSELIWDSDIRPEGITAGYHRGFDNISIGLVASGQWIMERSGNDDSYLAGGQGVLGYKNNDNTSINIGGSYFSYGNVKNYGLFYEDDNSFGNSAYTTSDTSMSVIGTDTSYSLSEHHYYMYDYELVELFAEATHHFNNIPVTVMGDYVTNTAVDSLKNGWMFGLKVGKTKKPGSWNLKYVYREVEKDAVFGLYTDSDFRGGGTNAKGHEISAGYQLMDHTTLAVTYFNNKIDLQADDQLDFQRWQIDMKFKF